MHGAAPRYPWAMGIVHWADANLEVHGDQGVPTFCFDASITDSSVDTELVTAIRRKLQSLPLVSRRLVLIVDVSGSMDTVAGGVPAMCDGVTQGTPGMELSLFSRDTIAMGTAVALGPLLRPVLARVGESIMGRVAVRTAQSRSGQIVGTFLGPETLGVSILIGLAVGGFLIGLFLTVLFGGGGRGGGGPFFGGPFMWGGGGGFGGGGGRAGATLARDTSGASVSSESRTGVGRSSSELACRCC